MSRPQLDGNAVSLPCGVSDVHVSPSDVLPYTYGSRMGAETFMMWDPESANYY